MKIKNTLIIAALTGVLFSGSAFDSNAQTTASTNQTETVSAKMTVLQIKPMQFRLSYNNPVSKNVVVRILDNEKNVLFTENKHVEAHYLKYFDLSTLLDGTYTFEITDGNEKSSQAFDILTTTSRVVSSIN